MQPLGPTISATRVGQHPNPSVSDLHGPTGPTRMIGKARHSEVIANGNALYAIEKHCSERALQHYLGHKNNEHTVRYTEMAPDRFKDFWRSWSRAPASRCFRGSCRRRQAREYF